MKIGDILKGKRICPLHRIELRAAPSRITCRCSAQFPGKTRSEGRCMCRRGQDSQTMHHKIRRERLRFRELEPRVTLQRPSLSRGSTFGRNQWNQ